PGRRQVDPRASLRAFEEGFLLSRAEICWFHRQYTRGATIPEHDPRVSPLLAKDLSGMPATFVVTAGFDSLRDEGEAYAKALEEAGTSVSLRRFDGLVHGFANLAPVSTSARAAVVEIAGGLRVLARR